MSTPKYKCSFPKCGKSFKRRDYLSRHIANHSAVKPFYCDICRNSFTRKDLLEKHRKSKFHRLKMKIMNRGGEPVFINTFLADSEHNQQETPPLNGPAPSEQSSKFMNISSSYKKVVDMYSVKNQNTDVNASVIHRNRAHRTTLTESPRINYDNTNQEQKFDSNVSRASDNGSGFSAHFFNESPGKMDYHISFENFWNSANGFEDSYGWLFGNDTRPLHQNETDSEGLYDFIANDVEHELDASYYELSENFQNTIRNLVLNEMKVQVSVKLLSYEKLNSYLNQYWNYFDPMYPVIHKPTFKVLEDSLSFTILFLSIVAIGITSAKNNICKCHEYLLAVELHAKLKLRIFEEIEFYQNLDKVPLQFIQAFVLNDFFGLYLGNSYQHKSVHIYHPMVINFLKERDLFVNLLEPLVEDSFEFSDFEWHNWIEYESLKRITFFAYLIDAQSTFLYAKNQCLSIFDIQMELPYTDLVWYASSPFEFFQQYKLQPRDLHSRSRNYDNSDQRSFVISKKDVTKNGVFIPNVKNEGRWPNFLWSLRRLMQPYSRSQKEYHMNCFSQFSRFIFLHGVLSLVRELRNINVLDIHIVPKNRLTVIAGKIEHSFFSWRSYFHRHIADTNAASLDPNRKQVILMNDYGSSLLFWSNITMFNLGLLGLYCDFDLVIMFRRNIQQAVLMQKKNDTQGSGNLQGASPGRIRFKAIELAKNAMRIKSWAMSKSGHHSNIEACNLLRMIFNNSETITVVSHIPFAIYISILSCWFYEFYLFYDQDDIFTPEFVGKISYQNPHDLAEEEILAYLSVTLDLKSDERSGSSSSTPNIPSKPSVLGMASGLFAPDSSYTPANVYAKPFTNASRKLRSDQRLTLLKTISVYAIDLMKLHEKWENSSLLINDLCDLLEVPL